MPHHIKRQHLMGMMYTQNGTFEVYCTCGWIELQEQHDAIQEASDLWNQHFLDMLAKP